MAVTMGAGGSGGWGPGPGSTFPPVAASLCSRNISYTVGLILRGSGGTLLALFTRPPKPVGDRDGPVQAREVGWADHPAWGGLWGPSVVPWAARASSPACGSMMALGRGAGGGMGHEPSGEGEAGSCWDLLSALRPSSTRSRIEDRQLRGECLVGDM